MTQTITMTQDEQDLQMANLANHAHPTQNAVLGLAPLTGKFRRAIKAAEYRGPSKPIINTDYREKAKIAAQNGETYDEAADRALQAKKLEQLKQHKEQRRKALSEAIQKRFNTAPEHIERSLIMRAAQERIKKARKIAQKHRNIAEKRKIAAEQSGQSAQIVPIQTRKRKTRALTLAAS